LRGKYFQGLAIAVSIPELLAKKTSIPGSFAVPPDNKICLMEHRLCILGIKS